MGQLVEYSLTFYLRHASSENGIVSFHVSLRVSPSIVGARLVASIKDY